MADPSDPTGLKMKPGGNSRTLAKLALVRDIAYVTFGKYGQYLITLVTLPLIARTLGTDGVGLLAVGMSAYFLGSLLIDMGITTFLAAELRDEDVRSLRGNYLAIRLGILSVIVCIASVVLVFDTHPHIRMVVVGLVCGGVSAMGEGWILLGQARFGRLMIIEMCGRVLYLVLIVAILPNVRTPYVAMFCLAGSSLVSVVWTWTSTIREYGMPRRPKAIGPMVRMGIPVLTSRMLENTYEQGVATLFSLSLSARSLGIFSASDRPVQAASSMLDAIGFGLLPRFAARRQAADFWHTIRRGILGVFLLSVVFAVALALVAPFAIPLVFGDNFRAAVPVMQLQAFILPGTAVASFVTTAVLPVCRDARGVLYGSLIGTACILIFLGVALHNHSVWTVVTGMLVAETVVACFYLLRVRHLIRLHPLVRPENSGTEKSLQHGTAKSGGA
ncbi:UNVERIFIED_CONTAM: O-antigen/teichoic acid export membrane protein [Williamsia faeni]